MKFSIGIPAYKAAFLRECIESVLAQTVQDFELIIVNDASPEGIDDILADFHSAKIQYYKNLKNFGALHVVDNWNKCLSYASGEYFILMGDDDKMAPDYLFEFSKLIEKYPTCNVYHCRTLVINEKSEPQWLTEPRPEFESVYDSILERMKASRVFFISDYVYRTSTLRQNGGFYKLPMAWASDDISAYVGAKDSGIAHTNKPVFLYRQNRLNISSTGNEFVKIDAMHKEEQWLREFVKLPVENDVDDLTRKMISDKIYSFIQKKKVNMIAIALNKHPSSIIKFIRARKQLRISIEEIGYSLLMAVKERRKFA